MGCFSDTPVDQTTRLGTIDLCVRYYPLFCLQKYISRFGGFFFPLRVY